MIEKVFSELKFFKSSFSYTRTWLWFGVSVLAFMGNCDPLGGVSGLVRSLGLDGAVYGSLLGFFHSSAVNLESLQLRLFEWIQLRFKGFLVTINGKGLLVLDAKKQAKSGKRMPGVKWHHQDSSSSSKKQFVTAHSFECMGVVIKCMGSVSCLIFLVKLVDGFRNHNRDHKTLKEKVGDWLESRKNYLREKIVVCDAWYAAQQILIPALDAVITIITRVGKDAVAYYDPIKKNGRGRPRKYGEKVILMSLFDSFNLVVGQVKSCSGEIQEVTYWSLALMWQPIKRKVLFVGTMDAKGRRIILLSTDLTLRPIDMIQAYVYRSSIEHTFWLSTQFFCSWMYRFWSKSPLTSKNLKGNFNLHFCNEELRTLFHNKIKAYELFLTLGFIAHAMFLFLGVVFKNQNINDNILFFRSRNREAAASIPVLRAHLFRDYQLFSRSKDSPSELGKFLLKKLRICSLDGQQRKAS